MTSLLLQIVYDILLMWFTENVCYIVYDDFVFGFFFQAEDGIRDVLGSRGLGDVYKRQYSTTRVSNPVCSPRFRASTSDIVW